MDFITDGLTMSTFKALKALRLGKYKNRIPEFADVVVEMLNEFLIHGKNAGFYKDIVKVHIEALDNATDKNKYKGGKTKHGIKFVDEEGNNMAALHVLMYINANPSCTNGDITKLGKRTTYLSILEKLDKLGFVGHAKVERIRIFTITEKGRKILDEYS